MASTILNPYIHFSGNAEEALNFYKSIFDGELTVLKFSDFPNMPVKDDQKNQVMHGYLTMGGGMNLMASDSMGELKKGENISISISGDDEATLTKYFEGLSESGNITEPLGKHPWGDTFGMVIDKFGIKWLVNISSGERPSS